MSEISILIKNGKIIDGSGQDAFFADIAISGDKIIEIGKLSDSKAVRVIDASGCYVTPGFFDMHSHADLTVASFPGMENYIAQGTTTVFTGHCALGVAPIHKYYSFQINECAAFAAAGINPLNGHIPGVPIIVETQKLRPIYSAAMGHELDWVTFAEFLNHLKKETIACNMYALVSAGNIRYQVMGEDYKRAATTSEVEAMKKYLIDELEHGALGLDFGFDYHPNIYSTKDEAIELAKCLKPYDAIMSAHWQARPFRHGLESPNHTAIDGITEFLEIGKSAGVRTHLSHLGVRASKDKSQTEDQAQALAYQVLELIEQYKKGGLVVTFDVIPPDCAGPFCFPELAFRFMAAIKRCGGLTAFGERLADVEYKRSIVSAIYENRHLEVTMGSAGYLAMTNELSDCDKTLFITKCSNEIWVGKSIYEIAQTLNLGSVETILEILTADVRTSAANINDSISKLGGDVFLASPDACIGYDNLAIDYNFSMGLADMPLETANANCFNGNVKYLQNYGETRLEDTIHKLTGRSAEVIRIKDRGLIREGFKADLLIINPKTLKANINLVDPRVSPNGFEYVFVNGKIAMENGALTGVRAGHIFTSADFTD